MASYSFEFWSWSFIQTAWVQLCEKINFRSGSFERKRVLYVPQQKHTHGKIDENDSADSRICSFAQISSNVMS